MDQTVVFYIIHSEPLNFRKENVLKLFVILEKENIKHRYNFITKHEPNEIDRPSLAKIINTDEPKDLPESSQLKGFKQTLNIRQVSNAMKHRDALEMIANNKDENVVHIVIEDDIVFADDIGSKLRKIIPDIVNNDMLFLGLPAIDNMKMEGINNVFEKFNIIPAIDAYSISPKIAKQIKDEFLPLYYCTHLQYTYILSKLQLSPKFTTPNVFADGSKVGVFTSLLNTNNKLFLNNDYNDLLAIVKKETLTEEDVKEGSNIIKKSQNIMTHPDMAYLQSVLELKKGNIAEAYKLMNTIYDSYVKNGCILNHESEFLRLYIDIHKHVQ